MELIKEEINNIRNLIRSGFCDPLPNEETINFLSGNSKMIRSKLALLYLKSQDKPVSDDIYTVLAAGEIMHNASLLHDDVLDGAKIRRGNTVIGEKFSYKVSILAGDYLLTHATKLILKLKNPEILGIFNKCAQKMTQSELSQYFKRNSLPSNEEYIQICKGKTAELFAAILESSAILAGLEREKARNFGLTFGTYFQIKNDISEGSRKIDLANGIFTAYDIMGIEKTESLLDNYRKDMRELTDTIPDNPFRQELEDLPNKI